MATIEPLEPPYEPAAQRLLDMMMPPGVAPIGLFRTFAKNLAMTEALTGWGGYELSPALSLSLRDREILIDRTCTRCGCEYEWGVHITFFAAQANLDQSQVASLTHGSPEDPCWLTDRDRLLIWAADELHDTATMNAGLLNELKQVFSDAQLLDIMMLCGWYHAIAFAANAAGVDLEPAAPRFDDYQA